MAVTFVALASGTGTNFAALADAMQDGTIAEGKMVGLVCNKENAPALEKGRDRAIPVFFIDSKNSAASTKDFHGELLSTLRNLRPDYILLAGYLKILPPAIVSAFPNRIVNIHPSLLPSFPGLHAIRQAIDHGVRWTGVTVHFVTAGLDEGPIIEQSPVEVYPSDTEASLHQRIRPVEHATYIKAVKKLASSTFKVNGRRVDWAP